MTIFWQILIEEVTDGDALLSLIPIKKKKKTGSECKSCEQQTDDGGAGAQNPEKREQDKSE